MEFPESLQLNCTEPAPYLLHLSPLSYTVTGLNQSDIVNNVSILDSFATLLNLQQTKNQTETVSHFIQLHLVSYLFLHTHTHTISLSLSLSLIGYNILRLSL